MVFGVNRSNLLKSAYNWKMIIFLQKCYAYPISCLTPEKHQKTLGDMK